MNATFFRRYAALASLLLFVPTLLAFRGDTLTGEARGSVFDVESRTPLTAATMTLTSTDRGWKKMTLSNAEGNYVFLQLEPGPYSVSASKDGFYTADHYDIYIKLNQPKVVLPPFSLRRVVSTPTQRLTLQGEQTKTAIIDLTSSTPNNPSILTFISEAGRTSLASTLDWSIRSNYDAALIEALPLRGGRSFDQLSFLSPGVFRVPFSSGAGPAVGIGVGSPGQFSVNGLRSRSNNFTVDGSDNNDEDIGVRRQGFVALVPQSVESVQEFQIMTAGFPAEFGRNSGAMVNAVSRSGKSKPHGTIYGLFNRAGWNAENPFNPDPQSHTQQMGTAFGGPLVSGGRAFYFASVEQQSARGRDLRHFVVPSAAERGLRTNSGFVPINELKDFFDDRDIPYSALAGQGVFGLYPLPNNPNGPFGANTYSQTAAQRSKGFTSSFKADWYIRPQDSFVTRYNVTDDDSTIPFTSDAINSSIGTKTRTQNLSLFLNSTRDSGANALRVSYGRTALAFPQKSGSPLLFGSSPIPSVTAPTSIQTPYGSFGPFGATGPIGQVAILPFSPIGVDVYNFPQGRVDNTFQASNITTWTRSKHTIKAGFDLRRSQLNSFSDRNSRPLLLFGPGEVASTCQGNPFCAFRTADGLLRGTDLAALGAPSGFLQTISTESDANTSIGLRFWQAGFFAQDDWKARPGFIVNAGLRYELYAPPTETNRRIEETFNISASQFPHLNPSSFPQYSGVIQADNRSFDVAVDSLRGFLASREKIYDSGQARFAPRIGFAWDVRGDGRTAIRGGYSISYDANLGAVTSQSRNVFPRFVPLNLDLNFREPNGGRVNSPTFFLFEPTQSPLLRQGTLNTLNANGDSFATVVGALFQQAAPSPGASLSSNGLAFTLPEKNYKTSYAQHVLASVEHQFGDNFLLSASGVSTRGLRLPRFTTPNAGLISTPLLISSFNEPLRILDFPPTPSGAKDFGRLMPGLGALTVFQNSAASGYNSLQVVTEKRLSRGLQLRGTWTWSHTIDEVSDPFDARGFFSLPQDGGRLDLDRASANFDVRHRVSGFSVWSRGNWQVSMIAEFQTGQPYTVNSAVDRNLDGNLTDRLNSTNGLEVHPGDAYSIRLSPAVSTSSLLAARSQNGSVGRNTFRAGGIYTVDTALTRTIDLGPNKLELRVEGFNLFNRTHYGIPVRILESPGFGRSYDLQSSPRTIRIAAKLRL